MNPVWAQTMERGLFAGWGLRAVGLQAPRGGAWLGWKARSDGHAVFHQAGQQVLIGHVQLCIPGLNFLLEDSQLLPELLQHGLGSRT